MDLNEMRARYEREEGYSCLNATARVCQDVILSKLAASGMRDRVTVKGGVLMCALSGSGRRATQDIDLDFVRYPMTDASIRSFVSALSNLGDGVTVRIAGEIEELSQQDYKGRRANLKVSDGRSTFDTKFDLGVHASAAMEQDELWFDVAHRQEGVCLLANSKEQVFAEKLKSLLRHDIRTAPETRFMERFMENPPPQSSNGSESTRLGGTRAKSTRAVNRRLFMPRFRTARESPRRSLADRYLGPARQTARSPSAELE
ncbi:nucleotidyl transferase AbiEii/AbiGii toxin family protein [Collinsella aerofaciens]|uniref:nucleotidyl transferase AbiEii/AbiGii toxin family protein n=1 Tax=Collinsella aerofaciens TaxID=74426 RepID=UPI0034A2A1AE